MPLQCPLSVSAVVGVLEASTANVIPDAKSRASTSLMLTAFLRPRQQCIKAALRKRVFINGEISRFISLPPRPSAALSLRPHSH